MDDLYGRLSEMAEAEGLTLTEFLKSLPRAELLRLRARVLREREQLLAEGRRLRGGA